MNKHCVRVLHLGFHIGSGKLAAYQAKFHLAARRSVKHLNRISYESGTMPSCDIVLVIPLEQGMHRTVADPGGSIEPPFVPVIILIARLWQPF